MLILTFHRVPGGCRLAMVHTNVPDADAKGMVARAPGTGTTGGPGRPICKRSARGEVPTLAASPPPHPAFPAPNLSQPTVAAQSPEIRAGPKISLLCRLRSPLSQGFFTFYAPGGHRLAVESSCLRGGRTKNLGSTAVTARPPDIFHTPGRSRARRYALARAAAATASMIFAYPVHRQRFPSRAALISSTVGWGFRSRRALAVRTKPGVQ